MIPVRVLLGERSYDIQITSHDTTGLGAFTRARVEGTLAFVVADSQVTPHADRVASNLNQAGYRVARATVPSGEESKSLSQAALLYDQLAEARADRKTVVVAVGGGVVGDLA